MQLIVLCLLILILGGCRSVAYNEEPYVVQGPPDPYVYLASYDAKEIFYGHEASFSIPFLGFIPLVGDWIGGKLLQFRSGAVRPILIPQYREKTYEIQSSERATCPLGRLHIPFGVQFD